MFLAAAVTGNLCVKTKKKKMGRSGRVASRVCFTLELRMSLPHAPSSSMALTLPPPPSSSRFALISKPPMCSNSTTAPPPSPDTPRQTSPPPAASVQKKSQPWPQDVFQFMRQHVEVLLLPSSHSSNSSTSTGGKEIRDCRGRNEQEEAPLEKNQRRRAATTESGSGIEVELRAQSPLPEDWEQFLDLKVRKDTCSLCKTGAGREIYNKPRAMSLSFL